MSESLEDVVMRLPENHRARKEYLSLVGEAAYEIQAPNSIQVKRVYSADATVFLAGSIEMGTAERWQDKVIKSLRGNVVAFNPRRDDWDSSWEQSIDNEQFRTQVEWELDAMAEADIIFMYFSPGTKSPIILLEFGLHAQNYTPDQFIVCCPPGFWRKGNVDVTASYFDLPVCEDFDHALNVLNTRVQARIVESKNEVF